MSEPLYELACDYQKALEALGDDSDDQAILDTLEALKAPLEEKAQNVAAYVLNQEAEADSICQVMTRLEERRKRIEKRAERIREYLLTNMQACGIREIKALDGTFSLKIKKNPSSVFIGEGAHIPPQYERVIPERREPDKAVLKEALRQGEIIFGVTLTQSERLEIKS